MTSFPRLVNLETKEVVGVNSTWFSIGRSTKCDYVVDNVFVSQEHLILKKVEDSWMLFIRNANGTIVNESLVECDRYVELMHGDVIRIGTQRFRFDELETDEKTESEEEDEEEKTETKETAKRNESQNSLASGPLDVFAEGLTCPICTELFIKAVTLNCSHSFCEACLRQWRLGGKFRCAICRTAIKTAVPTLLLNDFVEKVVQEQSEEYKEKRLETIRQREEAASNDRSDPTLDLEESDGDTIYSVTDYLMDYDSDSSPLSGPVNMQIRGFVLDVISNF